MHEVMNMEKSNPYSFYVVLADGIMEIPQDSNLSWITLFYALPKELVEKRPAYLELPRNIHQLLHSEEYRKLLSRKPFWNWSGTAMRGRHGNSSRCRARVA